MSNLRSLGPSETMEEQMIAERRAMRLWGGVVVGLLSLQVVMCVGAAILATNSEAGVVVPEYYQKALHYDDLHKPASVSVLKE